MGAGKAPVNDIKECRAVFITIAFTRRHWPGVNAVHTSGTAYNGFR
ncbi:hypothetical protein BH18ACI4_BH18ACI4_10450 [soil metagenome]